LIATGYGDTDCGNLDAILAQISTVDADIWVLTETSASIMPRSYPYAASSPYLGAPFAPDERAVKIWSRRRMRQIEALPFLPPGSADPATAASYALTTQDTVPVVCTLAETPLGPLLVYGAIITWPGDPGRQETVAHGDAQRSAIDRLAADWTGLRTSC
jgi:hypothetical protein